MNAARLVVMRSSRGAATEAAHRRGQPPAKWRSRSLEEAIAPLALAGRALGVCRIGVARQRVSEPSRGKLLVRRRYRVLELQLAPEPSFVAVITFF
jgi:hypothetical protein